MGAFRSPWSAFSPQPAPPTPQGDFCPSFYAGWLCPPMDYGDYLDFLRASPVQRIRDPWRARLHEDSGRILHGHHDWPWPWLLFWASFILEYITGYSWLAADYRRIRRLNYFAHGMVASLPHRNFIGIDGRRFSPVFGQDFNCGARGRSILARQFGLCGNSLWAGSPSRKYSHIGSFVARKARFKSRRCHLLNKVACKRNKSHNT